MPNLEELFIREFNMCKRNGVVNKNIFAVPLPDEVKDWSISKDLVAIKGISDDAAGLYKQLNKTVCEIVKPGVAIKKRKVDLIHKNFMIKDGKYVLEDVKIPSNSKCIISDINLKLPYKYSTKEQGFGYVDFYSRDNKTKYMYFIPKKYMYRVNQLALVLSVKNMKNYMGKGYWSWDFGTIFLHVIPYRSGRSYIGSKVLATSYKMSDFDSKVETILKYWQDIGVIPSLSLCMTSELGNLAISETVVGYCDYSPVEELSLGDKEVYGDYANREQQNKS